MYIRIVNLKFASEIEADAMQAYAEHELINKLPGILSIAQSNKFTQCRYK